MKRLTGWRRIADAMWTAPNDPQIYGTIDVDATAVLALVAGMRERGQRVTITHVVGRALALAISAVPAINVRLVAGYALPRPSVDVFFITAVEGGNDLSGVKVERANEKSVVEVAEELGRRAQSMKRGDDPDLAKSKRAMQVLPKQALRAALRFAAFLTGDLNQEIGALALRRAPFGSAMVTSVGMFGLPMGFAPLAWMYRVPILVLVGEVTKKPVVVGDAIEIRQVLPICATIDHRYVDGYHIAKLFSVFKAYLAAPEEHEPRS